jgi:hypothetical protein
VGFVALRQNEPAFSGRLNDPVGGRQRRSTRRYLSQRDKFHPTGAAEKFKPLTPYLPHFTLHKKALATLNTLTRM